MALTSDVHTYRYGVVGNASQPVNQPLTGSATVYRGSVAVTRAGYLVAASTPQSTDIVWGIIEQSGPGFADTGPGITAPNSTNGSMTVEVSTGSFWLINGTGADAIGQANVGAAVYLQNEVTVALTSGGGSRPLAGVVLEASDPLNVLAGRVAVKLGTNQTTGAP